MLRTLRIVSCMTTLVLCAVVQGQEHEEDDFEPRTEAEAKNVRPVFDTEKLQQVESLILQHANEFRRTQGLKELTNNKSLSETAQHFANFMARTRKFGHTADGQHHSERATASGYDYCIVLENIGYYFSAEPKAAQDLASKMFVLWRDSKVHRENLLDPDVTESGVGIAQDPESKYYFGVHMQGSPATRWIVFTITNLTGNEVAYTFLPANERVTLEPHTVVTHRRCRPPQVKLATTNDDQAVNVAHGDQLTISGEPGQLVLRVNP